VYGPSEQKEGTRRASVRGHLSTKKFSDTDERDAAVEKMVSAKLKSGYSEIGLDKAFTIADYDAEFAVKG
jgi:predicted DNA-binding WGR domain protein